MRKHTALLLVALLLLAAPSLYAQQTTGLSAWGIKAGMNVSKFVGPNAKAPNGGGLNYKPGVSAGLFATYSFTNIFGIQPELLYSTKGARWNAMDDRPNYVTRVDYIEIPVLAKADIPTHGTIQPSVYAGPDFAFRVRARQTVPGFYHNLDVNNDFKSSDIGMALGAGTSYALSRGQLTLDARYILGFSKIDNTPAHLNVRNSDFTFLLGYSFR